MRKRTVCALSALLLLWAPWAFSALVRPTDDLFAVSFVDTNEGWACGRWGSLLHTSDGGKTWTRQNTGVDYTLSSLSFVDRNEGWAVGDEGTILHTADGGKTWQKQKSPVTSFLMSVQFVTKSKGWVVTERTTILHTGDGGKTWAVQFSGEDFILKAVSFCDEQNGWAVGEYGFIYRTTDGGKTWKRQAGEFGFSESTGEVVAGNYLFGVTAVTPKTAWVVGIEGHVARTMDGGISWQAVNTGVPKVHLFGVAVTGNRVVVVGKGALLASSDLGVTWQAAQTEPTIRYGWLYGVSKRANEGFVAVGNGGWVYGADARASSWRLAGR